MYFQMSVIYGVLRYFSSLCISCSTREIFFLFIIIIILLKYTFFLGNFPLDFSSINNYVTAAAQGGTRDITFIINNVLLQNSIIELKKKKYMLNSKLLFISVDTFQRSICDYNSNKFCWSFKKKKNNLYSRISYNNVVFFPMISIEPFLFCFNIYAS